VAGGIAGLTAKIFVFPLDVVKKRLQVHGLNLYRAGKIPGRCPGILHTVVTIHKTEGVPAFFRGAVPSILKAGLQSALVFTLFEESKKVLRLYL